MPASGRKLERPMESLKEERKEAHLENSERLESEVRYPHHEVRFRQQTERRREGITPHPHGPENAERELKLAYHCAIEAGTILTGFEEELEQEVVRINGVNKLYQHAYNAFRSGDRTRAERWARAVKHLGKALCHEAKIHYLKVHRNELPYLPHAHDEYGLSTFSDTTADLLNSVADHPPPGFERMPEDMVSFLTRGMELLQRLEKINPHEELLRTEHIKAAHEYGRVVECLALAYKSEGRDRPEIRAS